MKKIAIVVVLYNDIIRHLPESYNDSIWIFVDNTPERDLSFSAPGVKYIPLSQNRGIAYAQNVGIHEAIKNNCSHIIFFDQDSYVSRSYINDIYNIYALVSSKLPNLFLLGPTVIDKQSGIEYKSAFHKEIEVLSDIIEKREIISSGSIISVEKIKQIGELDESMFIDYVDFEWCWRARAMGLISCTSSRVMLPHKVGRKTIYLWKHQVLISSPTRYFYQYRNYIYLCKRNYVPFQWKVSTGIKKILAIFYMWFFEDGITIEKNIWKGIIAGIRS